VDALRSFETPVPNYTVSSQKIVLFVVTAVRTQSHIIVHLSRISPPPHPFPFRLILTQ
jgi:hypothetical protein